jgi:hypothetical protein
MIKGENDSGCISREYYDLSSYDDAGFTAALRKTEWGESCSEPGGATRPGSGDRDDYEYTLSGGGVLRLTELAGAGGRCTSYVSASVSGSGKGAGGGEG